ncbi:hypothetical protein [Sphingopyxis sp. SCN 67-31]|uniref:hypothetical protein n=1 Tax=Sphingopyxis sp. SCN 67-31 TaxID=1660142 RepID=UPI00086DD0A6|nr:hypothetical protein [Sphingopyxis sp. SCN 67-31]ODU36610.1 MAG: hypothetical protein ABS88_00015 [Sphingopyxis sp. SCN 67-31]
MTTHMPDIQSLIERVEAATGPSYELDCAIWDAVYPGERQARFDALTAKGQPYHRRLGPADMDGYVKPLRSFTTSLDAAMTLVPDDCIWLRLGPGTMTVSRPDPNEKRWAKHFEATAATPALALVAAALRSRAQGER